VTIKYIQSLVYSFKNDFCPKQLGFFNIEKKYLMIQHSEDTCVFVTEEHASVSEMELFF